MVIVVYTWIKYSLDQFLSIRRFVIYLREEKKKDSVKVEVEMLSFPPPALTIYEYRTTIIYRLPLKYTLQTTFISFHLGILLKYNADATQI